MSQEALDIRDLVLQRALFEPLRSSSVLVTGATGLIGSMLLKTLHAANTAHGLGLRLIGQIRDPAKAARIFGDVAGDLELTTALDVPCSFVVHTLSPTSSRYFIEHPVETVRTSVESTIAVLESAVKSGASVVYLSSMEQYGVPSEAGAIMTEDRLGTIDHLNIRSAYSESKRLCECLCASYASEYGVNVKIARLAQTFGAGVPETDNRMPVQFARAAAEGRDIVLHTQGRSIMNFVYLTDALGGILTLLSGGAAGHAYNVCNDGETRSVRDIAELVARQVAGGRIGVRVEIPEGSMGYAPDVDMRLCSDKLRALGWMPRVTMEDAYRRLAAYLREEGRLNET